MTSLTKSLMGKLKSKERVAAQELVAIAKREAGNKAADADVKKLEQALHLTGKDVEQYGGMVALLQRIKELKMEAAKLSAASAAYVKAREALLPYQIETNRIEKERRDGLLQLEQARNVEYSKHLMAVKVQSELERLQYSHPELFGSEAIDLDSVTLTSGNGTNIINCRDEDAPFREVPESVWQEQAVRRQQIRGAATAQAREEYQDERNAWIQKQPKDYYGNYVSDEPFPKFEMPTWNEICANDWNRTLDGLAA